MSEPSKSTADPVGVSLAVCLLIVVIWVLLQPNISSDFWRKSPTAAQAYADPNFALRKKPNDKLLWELESPDVRTATLQLKDGILVSADVLPDTVTDAPSAVCFERMGSRNMPGGNLKACLAQTERNTYGEWASAPCASREGIQDYGLQRYGLKQTQWLVYCVADYTADAQRRYDQAHIGPFDDAVSRQSEAVEQGVVRQHLASQADQALAIVDTVCTQVDRYNDVKYYGALRAYMHLIGSQSASVSTLLTGIRNGSNPASDFSSLISYRCD